MEVKIRNVTVDDAEALIEHTNIVLRQSEFLLTTSEEFTVSVEKEQEWISEQLKDGNLGLVAEVEGKIVGLLNFNRSKRKRVAHLGYFGISVQKEYWHAGIGTKLIECLLLWARENPSIEKVYLEVFSHNEHAIRLYEKMGFVEEGRKKQYIKYEDGRYVDEIIMAQDV
ncbi:GNAT family N-acetyltransferase [Bacillus timonensis]|nr:GNAT family N-acetyltransferase [Bacillus timonensis]